MARLPERMHRVFWNVDIAKLDLERDASGIIARIVEYGRQEDVVWAIRHYGLPRIHRFFREAGHPEVSDRTVAFWRALFRAEDEAWPRPPAWRKSSSAPWIE